MSGRIHGRGSSPPYKRDGDSVVLGLVFAHVSGSFLLAILGIRAHAVLDVVVDDEVEFLWKKAVTLS